MTIKKNNKIVLKNHITIILILLILLSTFCISYYYTKTNIKSNDKPNNNIMLGAINQPKKDKTEQINNLIAAADKLKQGYYLTEAIELLNSNKELVSDKISNKIIEIEDYKKSFVEYTGDIEHIFFHSLMIYPELAFDKIGHDANGYNMWFITNNELKNMLPQLHQRGYVLMDITEIYKKNNEGVMEKQPIYLPEGKKPLIISQDDVNYYDYMSKDGFADRLIIDNNDEVSTVVRNLEGTEEITRDGDVVPILDDFIKEHPDFSYRGAKGILAVTGYEGVLGYDLKSEESIQEAKEVVQKLKNTGWKFASHSYTHNGLGYFGDNPKYKNLESDFERWKTRIEPIIGETNIYISPFGVTLKGENYSLVEKYGFEIYCNVNRNPMNKIMEKSVLTNRFNIDGYTFFKQPEVVNDRFFDVNSVIDTTRPTLK